MRIPLPTPCPEADFPYQPTEPVHAGGTGLQILPVGFIVAVIIEHAYIVFPSKL